MPPKAATHVIYRIAEPTPADDERLAIAASAAQKAGLDVSFAFEGRVSVLRSTVPPEEGGRLTGLLVAGASRAAHNRWLAIPTSNRPPYSEAMRKAVAELVTLFPLEPFYEAFKKFIGGSQWMVDREEMANALFRSTAQLDFATIEAHLSGSRLVALAPRLGAHLTDEDAQRWHQLEAGNVLSILTDRPELDYRQLHDPRYSRSERGQFLARAYAHFCGEVAAKRYRSSSVNEKPLLPVSQYPVLAGLLEDVVRSRIPTQSSSSARDVARLVLASDSVEAQVALFEIISAPTPQGQNHPFPGPSEFEVRRELVGDVWKAYVSATAENHRKVLRNGLQDILMAYTSGDLAAALVQQDPKAGAEGHGLSNRAPLSQARRIVRDLINAFLDSGDHELTATAVRITRSAQSLVKPVTRTAGARTLS